MPRDYLRKILTAKVYDVARESELQLASHLSARIKNKVLLKREDNQPVFSFKLRGAYNKMAHLPDGDLKRGVIAASAGNHAQGVALSAAKLGCKAIIVMPTTTPQVKIDAVKERGGQSVEIVLHGDSYSDAYQHALALEKKRLKALKASLNSEDINMIAQQAKRLAEFMENGFLACQNDTERRNWYRNVTLIDFDHIPEDVENDILKAYLNSKPVKDKMKIMTYLAKHRCKLLLEELEDF